MQEKCLHKFINANTDRPIYLDVNSIVGVSSYVPPAPSTVSTNPNYYHTGPTVNHTILYFASGAQFYVFDHISEVIALMEGRDPHPAKILFGKKE